MASINHQFGEEVKLKYQYLVQPGFVDNPVATFEFYWLDLDGGTTSLTG